MFSAKVGIAVCCTLMEMRTAAHSWFNLINSLSLSFLQTSGARESVGLCPFRGSYMREFELSHSNPVNRIIKISHAHNLHVMSEFGPFVLSYMKKRKLFTRKFSQTILRNHLGFTTSAITLAPCNVKVDSLKCINFQEN